MGWDGVEVDSLNFRRKYQYEQIILKQIFIWITNKTLNITIPDPDLLQDFVYKFLESFIVNPGIILPPIQQTRKLIPTL